MLLMEGMSGISWGLLGMHSLAKAWHAMLNCQRSITLFETCLSLLVLSDGLSRLVIWPSDGMANTLVNLVQLGLYALLVIDLIRRRYSVSTYMCVAISAVIFILGWSQTHDSVYIRDVLLIVAAKDIPFERTVRMMRKTMMAIVCIAVLTAILGIVPPVAYRRGGLSLGFAHPNQLALILTVIVLMWLAERRKQLQGKDLAAAAVWSFVVYAITRSRTPLILMGFVILLGIAQVRKPDRTVGRFLSIVTPFVPLLCLFFTCLTAMLLTSSQLVNRLDLILSNRIWLNWYAFSHHDLTMFGQVVDLTAGSGTVYNEIRGVWNSLVTVDNTYTLSLIALGLVPTLAFIAWNTFSLKRLSDSGDFYLVVLEVVLCIYGITEAQMMDVFNNFVLLATFTASASSSSLPMTIRKLKE